jgi:tripartite-type tricarboxylate transporter receptor subunit TctC
LFFSNEVIERLSPELPPISRSPEFSKRLVDIGQELTEPLLGEAFGRAIRDEAARWRELSTMAGVKEE